MWANQDWIGNKAVPEIPPSVQKLSTTSGYVPWSIRKSRSLSALSALADEERSSTEESDSFVHDEDELVVINVSGLIFETRHSTLSRFPYTLLGNRVSRARFYLASRGQYFFDRNRSSFEAILFYYQSRGELHRPLDVPVETFAEEINFFELGHAAIQQFRRDEGLKSRVKFDLPKNGFQRSLWLLVEYPISSKKARCFASFSMFMILLSVFIFCLETLPVFATYSVEWDSSNFSVPVLKTGITFFAQPFFLIEMICMAWFTFEILLRFYACPSKTKFFRSPINQIDLASVIPFYICLATYFSDISQSNNLASMPFLRTIRLMRVFRIFKLSRHSMGLQVLGKTMMASCREFVLLLCFIMVCVVLFASLVYYAEIDVRPKTFVSIPDSFWWAVVTMTTVGYGDMHPSTALGKLVGCICAVVGVLTIALPVPVIVSNFNYFYTKQKEEVALQASLRDRRGSSQAVQTDDTSLVAKTIADNPTLEKLEKVYVHDLKTISESENDASATDYDNVYPTFTSSHSQRNNSSPGCTIALPSSSTCSMRHRTSRCKTIAHELKFNRLRR